MKKIKFSIIENELTFILDSKDPIIQKMVVDALIHNGIEIPDHMKDFDPVYPYFGWNESHKSFDRWREHLIDPKSSLSLEKFMRKFTCETIYKMKLNNTYEAVVDLEEQVVKVGCQTFDFKTIRELATLTRKKIK